jgi:5-methyltetrahydrofolate--homocysteine methyltransferase
VVEVDGGIHHQQQEYDQGRTEVLEGLGLRVIRLTNQQVLTDMQKVIATIKVSTPEIA